MALTLGGRGYSRPDGMNFGLGGGGPQHVDLTGGRPSARDNYNRYQQALSGGFQQVGNTPAPPMQGPQPMGRLQGGAANAAGLTQGLPPAGYLSAAGGTPGKGWGGGRGTLGGDGTATAADRARFFGVSHNGPTTFDNATGQPINNAGDPAWMSTPEGQAYMAQVVARDPLAAQAANPNAFNSAAFGIDGGGNTAPPTGLIGSEQALLQALGGATNTLNTGMATADSFLSGSADAYNPYVESGLNAFGLQGDLSGVNGQAAFDAAFLESPVQAFLREQGERSVTQNAAALGGLGGGNVMKELTRYGTGVAGQQLQQQIDNVGRITNLGFDATGNQTNINNARGDLAYQNAGTIASGIGSVGQIIAGDRNQAGRDYATAVGGTTSALADLINNQGSGQADIYGAGGSNIASIFMGLAGQLGMSQADLAAMLSNINTGSATNTVGLPAVGGFVQPNTIIQDTAAITGAIGTGINAWNNAAPATTTPVIPPPATTPAPQGAPY